MKKGLKIGVVALAIATAATTIVSTGKVEAQSSSNNIVQVTIGKYNNGQNTCTLGNYNYEFDAAITDVSKETGNVADCKFGKQAGTPVYLQLSGNLVATSGDITNTIPGSNVKLTNTEWTQVPTIGSNTAINSYTNFNSSAAELFTKNPNVVGDASGTVMIQVTVPAGTPEGTYNGELVFTYGG